MEIGRKLEDICQSLTLLVEQGDAMRFQANSENMQRINGLLEDLHEALMGYQVSIPDHLFSTISYICARLHCKKIYMMRAVSTL